MRDLLATFTLNLFSELLENEEVEKLRCKLSGYVYGPYTMDQGSCSLFGHEPFYRRKRSAVFTVISKHSLNQELNESSDANLIDCDHSLSS